MLTQTNVPVIQKAVRVIYDMSEDTKIREAARMREKALHDEASLLAGAREEGIEIGREDVIAKMRASGLSDEMINKILNS